MLRLATAVLLFTGAASAAPFFLSVNNNNAADNRLVRVDAATGALIDIGGLGLTNVDIEGLAHNPLNGSVWGIDDNQDRILRINPLTGAATVVATATVEVDDAGLAFSQAGQLFFANTRTGDVNPELYTINTTTGALTLIGALSAKINGLAFFGGVLYGLGNTNLYTINTTTAGLTSVGALGRTVLDGSMEFDSSGNILAVRDLAPDNSGQTEIFQINRLTGAASGGLIIGSATNPITLEGLAADVPEPGTMVLVSMVLAGLALRRRK